MLRPALSIGYLTDAGTPPAIRRLWEAWEGRTGCAATPPLSFPQRVDLERLPASGSVQHEPVPVKVLYIAWIVRRPQRSG